MEKSLKELLLKDLCARLPYGVKVKRPDDGTPDYVSAIDIETGELMVLYNGYTTNISRFRPYLRPMSSMTEEERNELRQYCREQDKIIIYDIGISGSINSINVIDWLNAHHFDFRNLIERGLAIGVTKNENPYEQSK